MRNKVCKMIGMEYPIFAFSHCRDVVIEVSKAGGLGVLGIARMTPDILERELTQIDKALNGLPYGVDVLNPAEQETSSLNPTNEDYDWADITDLEAKIPKEYFDLRDKLCKRFGVTIPDNWATREIFEEGAVSTVERSTVLGDITFSHPVRFVMSALGPPSPALVKRAHDAGAFVGGMCGLPRHVQKQKDVGVDLVAAIGTEAAGHVGEVTTMVLVPQIVDAAGSTPVLAGGGIGDGRRFAAAMCLGASGIWTGSIWLATKESDLDSALKQRLIAADSSEAEISFALSGKSSRLLKTPWFDAWKDSGLPPLKMPLQGLLQRPVMVGAWDQHNADVMYTGIGQIVAEMKSIRSSRDVFQSLASGFVDTASSLAEMLNEND